MGMEEEQDFVRLAQRGVECGAERESRAVIADAVRKAMASAWERGVHYCSYIGEDGTRRIGRQGTLESDALKNNPYVDRDDSE